MPRGHPVEVGGRGEAIPYILIPAVAGDPLAGGQAGRLVLYALEALRQRGRLTIDLVQANGIPLKMDVGVGQAGQEIEAAEVYGFRGGAGGRVGAYAVVRTDGENLSVADGQGGGVGEFGIERVDVAVEKKGGRHR